MNNSLSPFCKWVKPTYQEVTDIFEKVGLNDKNFEKKLGVNERTYRRWTSKKTVNRQAKSPIPYGAWCVVVALANKELIFGEVIAKADLSKVPKQYICTFDKFESPTSEVLTSFVGRNSITGLTRTELANLFGWNPAYLGREFNNGKIGFLNWVLLLLLCRVEIKKLINIKL